MYKEKVDIDAIPGERWFPKETNFEDDMPEYWGDFGVCSEVDTLKAFCSDVPKRSRKF